LIFYFEEPDEAGFRAEPLDAEPLFALEALFVPEDLPVPFCALAADADFALPDLSPPPVVLAIGVLGASFAPAVFLGAADLDDELDLLPLDEPADDPELLFADPELLEPPDFEADVPELFDPPSELFAEELELFEAEPDDLDDVPELLVEPAADFVAVDLPEPEELLEPPDEPAVLFDAEDFVEPFEPELEALLPFAVPDTDSIADTAAPVTAPAAAPARTSPIASLAFS